MAFIGSSTPLSGNAEWDSTTQIADRSDRVAGIVKSDQGGTLYVEQSFDGTNWDLSKSISVTGGTGTSFSEELVAPYYRVRYVNGGTNQGSFRLNARTTAAGEST